MLGADSQRDMLYIDRTENVVRMDGRLVYAEAVAFDREPPRFVALGEDPQSEELAGEFGPYFRARLTFDARRGRKLGFRPPPLEQYFGALMDYADRARWGKKPLPRWAAADVAQGAAA